MSIVKRTIEALAEPRKRAELARDIGVPPQTVQDWIGKGNIPHWRRPGLIEAARRKGLQLEPEVMQFLGSKVSGRDWAKPVPAQDAAA